MVSGMGLKLIFLCIDIVIPAAFIKQLFVFQLFLEHLTKSYLCRELFWDYGFGHLISIFYFLAAIVQSVLFPLNILRCGGTHCPHFFVLFLPLRIFFDSFIYFFYPLNLISLSSSTKYPSSILTPQEHLVRNGEFFCCHCPGGGGQLVLLVSSGQRPGMW